MNNKHIDIYTFNVYIRTAMAKTKNTFYLEMQLQLTINNDGTDKLNCFCFYSAIQGLTCKVPVGANTTKNSAVGVSTISSLAKLLKFGSGVSWM